MPPSPHPGGFFKLQRKFFSHPLWQEPRVFSRAEAFLDLLQLAAYTRHKILVNGSFAELLPGQLFASERFLSGRWGWSGGKVRRFIEALASEGMAGVEMKQGMRLITLTNYAKYAAADPAGEAPAAQPRCTDGAAAAQSEEGGERKEGESVTPGEATAIAPGNPGIPKTPENPAIPTPDQVARYFRTLPAPGTLQAARAFHDTQQAAGWIMGNGRPIVDWRAAARRYLARWHEIEHLRRRPAAPVPRTRHHNGYHENPALP